MTALTQARRKAQRHMPGEEGVWVFILGDMTVFALLFGVFVYERADNLDVFRHGQEALNKDFGAIYTLLLLTSSLFVVLAVHALRREMKGIPPRLIAGAFVCGLGFIGMKAVEYSEKIDAGLTPAANDFYMYFFVLTGIHLLHLVIGMGVLIFVWRLSRGPTLDGKQRSYVESGASYWHMVDLLWLVLFALLYLMR